MEQTLGGVGVARQADCLRQAVLIPIDAADLARVVVALNQGERIDRVVRVVRDLPDIAQIAVGKTRGVPVLPVGGLQVCQTFLQVSLAGVA